MGGQPKWAIRNPTDNRRVRFRTHLGLWKLYEPMQAENNCSRGDLLCIIVQVSKSQYSNETS